uniref:ATP synthase F0 subunit 8 n=1 Tax=Dentathalia scutellariae TaxID=1170499 RepID=UPI0022010AEB|nr:ATP synthase F0 subunit 8 [Dentathalia scutellariae]UXW93337.1 ATP synthase F0 subunit 8 [Dentathalia scutellariae]
MPQMYPMNWIMFFFFYLTLLNLFLILNYYLAPPKIKNNQINQYLLLNKNWKW